jgi:aldose 1-epimerase
VIAHGPQRAVITQVGATLREYNVRGVPVIDGFDIGQRSTDGRGQVLAPWPNRLAEGRYEFGGQTCQAALNEPGPGNAIHGLVRWLEWAEIHSDSTNVTLGCMLYPQPGFEWQLRLEVCYTLGTEGLTVTASAVNTGPDAAPFGMGFHPYLSLGIPIDDVDLTVPARSQPPPTDPDRPPAPVAVTGTLLDFRAPSVIGVRRLDTAFTDLDRGSDGRAVAELSDPARGQGVRLWVDESFPYLMVYTGDQVGRPERRRRAVAIEPMTCPPNALRSGTGRIALAPGESWRGEWGLTATT